MSKRGVPWVSILLAFVVGLIVFLPFPSWQSLVGLVTSATAIMYAFAPVSLGALRRSDPDRERPYRLPFAEVLSPLGFVAADLIVYWSGWKTVNKLFGALIVGLDPVRHLDGLPQAGRAARGGLEGVDLGAALAGGDGGDLLPRPVHRGPRTIPFYVDLSWWPCSAWSSTTVAVAVSMPAAKVQEAIAAEEVDEEHQPELKVAG